MGKKRLQYALVIPVVLCCILSFQPIAHAGAQKTLLIGLATPLSGLGADWGRMQKEGAELGIEEINSKGGIRGYKFAVDIQDDKADPKEAATVAKLFSSNKNIKVVIGHCTSPTSFAAAPIYQRARVPMLISLASNPALPDQGDYIFQNSTTQFDECPAVARYAVKGLGARRVALIYINDDWGSSVRDVLPKEVEKLGGKMAAIEAYAPGEIDFRNLLTKIAVRKPDILFGAFHPAEAAQLIIQAKDMKIPFPVLLSSGAQTYSFIRLAGPAAEGTVFATGFDPTGTDPFVQNFVKSFKTRFNNENPTLFSSYVYDSIYLIATAVRNIKGDVTRKKLRDALANLKGITTTAGVLSCEPNGHFGPRRIVTVIVKNKTFVFDRAL